MAEQRIFTPSFPDYFSLVRLQNVGIAYTYTAICISSFIDNNFYKRRRIKCLEFSGYRGFQLWHEFGSVAAEPYVGITTEAGICGVIELIIVDYICRVRSQYETENECCIRCRIA